MQVTNNSQAPQGVHTLGGIAYVFPGETRDLDLNSDQVTRAGQVDGISLKGKPNKGEMAATATDAIDIPDNEVDQLRQQLDTQTVEIEGLKDLLADQDTTIAELKTKANDDAQTTEITRLNGVVAERDTEISGLKELVAQHEATIEQLKASASAAPQQPDPTLSQQAATPVGPFEVKDTTPGWFGIFGADGVQVGKSIRSADADAFRAMDADAQLAYLTAPAAPASA